MRRVVCEAMLRYASAALRGGMFRRHELSLFERVCCEWAGGGGGGGGGGALVLVVGHVCVLDAWCLMAMVGPGIASLHLTHPYSCCKRRWGRRRGQPRRMSKPKCAGPLQRVFPHPPWLHGG